MTNRKMIPPEEFAANLFDLFHRKWFLLTSGCFGTRQFNTMTVSWGFLGEMWMRPTAIAVVRPQRYTLEFMDRYDSFTLCAFGESFREALKLCGAKSGRELNKVEAAGLTAIPSESVSSPGFQEAELILECRKVYRGEFRKECFLDKMIPQEFYPGKDFHRIFVGEITQISGTGAYRRNAE
ncbi:MAG: Flavoredoxin [Lentisphaerae bacterium ADurb.Bin242]|nr:MAG: Flavoredoxin [Lentisphaerae bacterium ADurb.Bin242]